MVVSTGMMWLGGRLFRKVIWIGRALLGHDDAAQVLLRRTGATKSNLAGIVNPTGLVLLPPGVQGVVYP